MDFLRKKMLTEFLNDMRTVGFDVDTIDYFTREINDGHYDDSFPEEMGSKMWIFERIAWERQCQDEVHEFPEDIRLAVLMEEVGEVANELQNRRLQIRDNVHLRMELIQVAAVAVRWIEALEESK